MDQRLHPLTALLMLLAATTAGAGDFWHKDTGVLPADKAFQLMPVEAHGKTLRIEWDIAPGYYLYLNRLKFESTEPRVTLGAPKLPAGEKHIDQHFGEVAIQRAGHLRADLPVNALPKTLKLTYQGCAEAGVCLPPQVRVVAVVPVE